MSINSDRRPPRKPGEPATVDITIPVYNEEDALPRTIAVVQLPDRSAALELLRPWARWLSTVGTDEPGTDWLGARVCALGQMQRPPVDRLHDGVDLLRATLRP